MRGGGRYVHRVVVVGEDLWLAFQRNRVSPDHWWAANIVEQAPCVPEDCTHAKTWEIIHGALLKLYRAHQFD